MKSISILAMCSQSPEISQKTGVVILYKPESLFLGFNWLQYVFKF